MDNVLLLVAVNGFALAALILCGVFFFSESSGLLVATGLRVAAVKASPSSAVVKLQRKLDLAGNPRNWSVERFFTAKGGLAIGLGVLAIVLSSASGAIFSFRGIVLIAMLVIVGFFIPNVILWRIGSRRQEKMQRELADVLDLMSVSMRAGLAFDGAMAKVAGASDGPLAAEFARMLNELRMGEGKTSVLRSLIDRSSVDDLHYVVQALIQAHELGIPISDVLTQQAREMRVKRRQRAEEKSQKITLKILFPMLFCIFPVIMVVVIAPSIIRIVAEFTRIKG